MLWGIDELATTTKTEMMITFTTSFEANEVGKMYISTFCCTVQKKLLLPHLRQLRVLITVLSLLLNNGGASMTGGSITTFLHQTCFNFLVIQQ